MHAIIAVDELVVFIAFLYANSGFDGQLLPRIIEALL